MPRRKNKPLKSNKVRFKTSGSNIPNNTITLRGGIDPVTKLESQISKIPAGRSNKEYQCPYCNQIIPKAASHIVVVPNEMPDLRRHWHLACFNREYKP